MSLIRSGLRPFQRLLSTTASAKQISEQKPESDRPAVPTILRKSKPKAHFAPSYLLTTQPKSWELERLRVVPKLPTFYGGNPVHDDNMNHVRHMIKKHSNLPTRVLDEREIKAFKFISFEDYRKSAESGTRLKNGHHKELIEALNRLRSIEPELMPKDVIELLNLYSSQGVEKKAVTETKIKTLDEFGRANAVGKRKTSVAHISMVRGDGQVLVNGKPFAQYFASAADRVKLGYPFQVVSQESQYNVFITAEGGGISGQAEAAMYGIAKALVVFNPLLKPRLRQAGLMTRDARKVERKKPGKVKARKSPTWVKR